MMRGVSLETDMLNRPTLRDIAKIAKISHVTVSLALRSHPKIPEPTRKRIQAIATKLGYRPDPMLSALTAYRRGASVLKYQGTLAMINSWNPPSQFHFHYSMYWQGALERCQELGYQMEEFRLAEFGMKGSALSKVLRARNIPGLLLGPQQRDRAHLHLDWAHFSAVAFGFSLARPRLHVVTTAQYRSSVIAMRSLRAYGYRRIGYVSDRGFDERTDHNFTAGFLIEQRRLKAKDQIPLLIHGNVTPAQRQSELRKWCKLHHPDVILTPMWMMPGWLDKLGYTDRKKLGVAVLGTLKGDIAGIDQREHLVGRTAVDRVVGMIHQNERGVPDVPLRTLVEGLWYDAPSVHHLFTK